MNTSPSSYSFLLALLVDRTEINPDELQKMVEWQRWLKLKGDTTTDKSRAFDGTYGDSSALRFLYCADRCLTPNEDDAFALARQWKDNFLSEFEEYNFNVVITEPTIVIDTSIIIEIHQQDDYQLLPQVLREVKKQTNVSNLYIVDPDHPYNFSTPFSESPVTGQFLTNKNLSTNFFELRFALLGAGDRESEEAKKVRDWCIVDKTNTISLVSPSLKHQTKIVMDGGLAPAELYLNGKNARMVFNFKEEKLRKIAGVTNTLKKTRV